MTAIHCHSDVVRTVSDDVENSSTNRWKSYRHQTSTRRIIWKNCDE